MIDEVIFDVETQKFFDEIDSDNPADLKVSIVSAYKRKVDSEGIEQEGKMYSFWENEIEKLFGLFTSTDRIIGFNSLHFDVPVLQPYTQIPLNKLPHLDIMKIIKENFGRRISLDAIAHETLKTAKIDHGANAVIYWRKGDENSLSKLKKYCESDVLITKDIYDFGVKNKILKFKDKWNTLREVNVDFSYPKEDQNTVKQQDLF